MKREQPTPDTPGSQLRCSGCGKVGEAPRIWFTAEDKPAVVLKPIFVDGGKVMLLCDQCRAKLARHTKWRRRS